VDKLTVEGEVPKLINNRKTRQKDVFDAQKPPDVDLKTTQNLRQRLRQNSKRLPYKYLSELFIASISFEIKTNITNEILAVPGHDILIFIRIYHPFIHRGKTAPKSECCTLLRLHNVIAILGSQTLAHLRDKISCVADYSISKECSNNLDNALGPMAKVVIHTFLIFN
ncbi:hypothetical protein WN51_05721, partial [Melipona quadrifasciata]